jgi:hypothetical protein
MGVVRLLVPNIVAVRVKSGSLPLSTIKETAALGRTQRKAILLFLLVVYTILSPPCFSDTVLAGCQGGQAGLGNG